MRKMAILFAVLMVSNGCGFVHKSIKSSPLTMLLGKEHCAKEKWGKLCTRLKFSGTAGNRKLKIDGVAADPLRKIRLKNRYTPPGGFLPSFSLPQINCILYHSSGIFYIPMWLKIRGIGTKVGILKINLISGQTRWISGNPTYM